MRTEILDYIETLDLGTYTKSDKLPYTTSGQSLYLANMKTIYVDQPTYTEDPIVSTLDNVSISGRVSSVTIYFSQDAKSLPANYETLVTSLRNAKNITTLTNIHRRECDVSQTYNNDILVTEIVIRLTTIQ
jgi:hypothetical protein